MEIITVIQIMLFILGAGLAGGYENGYASGFNCGIAALVIVAIILALEILKTMIKKIRRMNYERNGYRYMQVLRTDKERKRGCFGR